MRRVVGLFPATLMAAMTVFGQTRDTTVEKPPVVRRVRGDVVVWRSSSARIQAIAKESPVLPADRLGTPEGGYGVLLTEGNTIITLKGVKVDREKGLSLERVGKKLVVRLLEGKVILDSFETEIVVQTPQGRVEGNKVYFVVEATEKATTVVAIHGELTLTNSMGSVTVEPGQKSEAAKDAAPTKPEKADLARETRDLGTVESAQNLIRNPGLEQDLRHWTVRTVGKMEAVTLENKLSHSGTQCVRVEVSNRIFGSDRTDWLPFWQEATLKPGQRYLARAYLRTETKEGLVIPRLQVEPNNDQGADYSEFLCEKTWKMARIIFTAKDSLYRIHLRSNTKSDKYDCTIFADDFFLAELPDSTAERR